MVKETHTGLVQISMDQITNNGSEFDAKIVRLCNAEYKLGAAYNRSRIFAKFDRRGYEDA